MAGAISHSGIQDGFKDEALADFLKVLIPKEQHFFIVGHPVDNNTQETSETFHNRSEEGTIPCNPRASTAELKALGEGFLH